MLLFAGPPEMVFLNNLMMYMSTIGFGLALANALIAFSRIRDLNEFTLTERDAHKLNGRIAAMIFYLLSAMCIYFALLPRLNPERYGELLSPTIFTHTFIGGFLAFILFSIKIFFAKFKKDTIYAKGKILGPIGIAGWAIAYFTSNVDFYFFASTEAGPHLPLPELMPTWIISLLYSIAIGLFVYVLVKSLSYKKSGGSTQKASLHGVAMILHGITFGYEGSAKELIGTPVLYKYVFPKTYQFLERYAERIGLDMNKLKSLNLNEAMELAMKKFAEIGMAEKIKIEWVSDTEFTIESINCSTAAVRSYMEPNELTNSICPWAILAATIANALTGQDLQINPSEFNKIGSKSKLKLVDKKE